MQFYAPMTTHNYMENKPKLYLNMIIGINEPPEMVKRSIDSVKNYVDGIYIGLNYPKDQQPPTKKHAIVKLLQKYDNMNLIIFPWEWNFASARQKVLDATPNGPDCYIYWQDVDDVLQGAQNLRGIMEDIHRTMHASAFFKYLYMIDFDEQGNIHEVVLEHWRERIVRNDGTFVWKGWLHETMINQKQENVMQYRRPECVVIHYSADDRFDKNLSRNIEILEKQLQAEERKDPRTLIYLAKAYFDRGKGAVGPESKIDFDMALVLFNEYLTGSGVPGTVDYQEASGWREERATAWKYVGEIAFLAKNYTMAKKALLSAIDEFPYYPDYYIDLAMYAVVQEDFKEARHWLKIGASMDIPETTHIVTPRDLKTRALQVALECNIREGKWDDAETNIKNLLDIFTENHPNHQMYKDQLRSLKETASANKAAQSIVYLGKYLEASNDPSKEAKLTSLAQSIPSNILQERFASEMRHRFIPPKKWEKDEITILCGPGVGYWTPDSIAGGIGGSEEAVIYLSQELKKLGWKVTVYGNPGEKAGDFDGVTYLPWYDCNPRDYFNVLIAWRFIGYFDADINARFTMLWLHDVPNNPDFTKERLARVDKIAVLSDYHRSILRMFDGKQFHQVPDDKIFLTANGIPTISTKIVENLDTATENDGTLLMPVKRKPHTMIYSSSPDRGLVYLLLNWERVREAVPDAELHIFYGFETFDAFYKDNPGKMEWKQQMLQLMKKPGIKYHGRVGHKHLHEAMTNIAVWAYPTDFTEISCITAMKAQRFGAIPVCTTLAALEQTVANGYKVDVDITDEEGQEEYFNTLIKVLKDEEGQEQLRRDMMQFAQDYYDWKHVAFKWHELFSSNIQDLIEGPEEE